MALVLKTDKTFTPQSLTRMGLDIPLSGCYAVVDGIDYNKSEKHCLFALDIYADKPTRDNKLPIIDRYNFSFNKVDFDRNIGNDGFTVVQAYNYLSEHEQLQDWESDE